MIHLPTDMYERAELARTTDDPEVLAVLVKDKELAVRIGVAWNPNIDLNTLGILAKDQNPIVREAALTNLAHQTNLVKDAGDFMDESYVPVVSGKLVQIKGTGPKRDVDYVLKEARKIMQMESWEYCLTYQEARSTMSISRQGYVEDLSLQGEIFTQWKMSDTEAASLTDQYLKHVEKRINETCLWQKATLNQSKRLQPISYCKYLYTKYKHALLKNILSLKKEV